MKSNTNNDGKFRIIKGVPYIEDKKEKFASCQGPPSTLMVFKYFRPSEIMNFPKLYKRLGYTHATWFFETYIVRLFHKYNIPARYYSNRKLELVGKSNDKFRRLTNLNIVSPDKFEEVDIKNYDSSVRYVKRYNLFENKKTDIDFLKSNINKNKLIIVTVNRNVLTKENGFKAHFLIIKGYDKDCFICNDAYLGENIKIGFNKFNEAFYQKFSDNNEVISDVVVIG